MLIVDCVHSLEQGSGPRGSTLAWENTANSTLKASVAERDVFLLDFQVRLCTIVGMSAKMVDVYHRMIASLCFIGNVIRRIIFVEKREPRFELKKRFIILAAPSHSATELPESMGQIAEAIGRFVGSCAGPDFLKFVGTETEVGSGFLAKFANFSEKASFSITCQQ